MRVILYYPYLDDLPVELRKCVQSLIFEEHRLMIEEQLVWWQHKRGYYYGMDYTHQFFAEQFNYSHRDGYHLTYATFADTLNVLDAIE